MTTNLKKRVEAIGFLQVLWYRLYLVKRPVFSVNPTSDGDGVKTVNSGVWSWKDGLLLFAETYRDGRDLARQVRPALTGVETDMQSVEAGQAP